MGFTVTSKILKYKEYRRDKKLLPNLQRFTVDDNTAKNQWRFVA
jgi:hypothetical protein